MAIVYAEANAAKSTLSLTEVARSEPPSTTNRTEDLLIYILTAMSKRQYGGLIKAGLWLVIETGNVSLGRDAATIAYDYFKKKQKQPDSSKYRNAAKETLEKLAEAESPAHAIQIAREMLTAEGLVETGSPISIFLEKNPPSLNSPQPTYQTGQIEQLLISVIRAISNGVYYELTAIGLELTITTGDPGLAIELATIENRYCMSVHNKSFDNIYNPTNYEKAIIAAIKKLEEAKERGAAEQEIVALAKELLVTVE